MGNRKAETLQARMDVLEVVISELARALPASRAAAVSDSVRLRLAEVAGRSHLPPEVDEAVSMSAARVLTALDEKRLRR